MKTYKYSGLSANDVLQALACAGRNYTIRRGWLSWRPAAGILEDGIFSSGSGLFLQLIDGRRSGYVSRDFLVSSLVNTDFEIVRCTK